MLSVINADVTSYRAVLEKTCILIIFKVFQILLNIDLCRRWDISLASAVLYSLQSLWFLAIWNFLFGFYLVWKICWMIDMNFTSSFSVTGNMCMLAGSLGMSISNL